MILVLKLVLVPALIALASTAVTRWGPRVGGLLASLPLVAGPALLFLSVEQGLVFAAQAAHATLVALVGVAGSALAYAWLAQRAPWWPSLLASWTCFVMLTLAIQRLALPLVPALVVALASFAAGRALLPPPRGRSSGGAAPAWDLPLRMLSAAGLVLVVTEAAARLGPTLTGAFTPFPIALTILLAFAHARQGAATVVRFLHGFLPGMWSFAAFCFVMSAALPTLGMMGGFALALAVQLAVQGAILRRPLRGAWRC